MDGRAAAAGGECVGGRQCAWVVALYFPNKALCLPSLPSLPPSFTSLCLLRVWVQDLGFDGKGGGILLLALFLCACRGPQDAFLHELSSNPPSHALTRSVLGGPSRRCPFSHQHGSGADPNTHTYKPLAPTPPRAPGYTDAWTCMSAHASSSAFTGALALSPKF